MTDAALLRIDGVAKQFGALVAVRETTLSLPEGSFTSLVGPSGCGKSTLFNIVSGLVRPDRGRVWLSGRDVTATTGQVGYMLQKDLLVPWRTVLGNIVLGAAMTRGVRDADRVEAAALAARYGLGEFLDHYPHALSGGMRQRVALMRTLVTNRPLLLLDEPFGALDAQTRLEMQEWLLEVWGEFGRTVFFTTHDVDEAIFLSDRVVVFSPRPGGVVADFAIDLPRPRGVGVLTSPVFNEVKARVLALLHSPAGASQ